MLTISGVAFLISFHNAHELLCHNSLQMWERLRGGFNEQGQGTTLCPSGLHPDGTCSCDSSPTTEESSNRASISRIVMLAEALFEVVFLLLELDFC